VVEGEDVVGIAYSPQSHANVPLVLDQLPQPGYYGTTVRLDPGVWWVEVRTAAYTRASQTIGFTVDGTRTLTAVYSPAPVHDGLSMPVTTRAKWARVLIAVGAGGLLMVGA